MDWTQLGLPGGIVLVAGMLFFWYHNITQATIKKLETQLSELDRSTSPTPPANAEGGSQQVIMPAGTARDISLSTVNTPSVQELEEKDEREKIRSILNLFDRKSVGDMMHEEDIMRMCNSLNELRVQIQKGGVATVADPEIRVNFEVVRDQIHQVLVIGSVLADKANITNRVLDLRSVGMIRGGFAELESYNRGQSRTETEQRFENILKFCKHRVRERKIAESMAVLYAFGAIDELKHSVQRHLEKIRSKVC